MFPTNSRGIPCELEITSQLEAVADLLQGRKIRLLQDSYFFFNWISNGLQLNFSFKLPLILSSSLASFSESFTICLNYARAIQQLVKNVDHLMQIEFHSPINAIDISII